MWICSPKVVVLKSSRKLINVGREGNEREGRGGGGGMRRGGGGGGRGGGGGGQAWLGGRAGVE